MLSTDAVVIALCVIGALLNFLPNFFGKTLQVKISLVVEVVSLFQLSS